MIDTLDTDERMTVFRPPYDLVSDLLLVFTLCPAAGLRTAFPGVPFLSLFGRIPLTAWFGKIRRITYRTHDDKAGVLGGLEQVLYDEVTVIIPLKTGGFFVPVIYVNSELSVQIGRGVYGMPKHKCSITWDDLPHGAAADLSEGTHRSTATARWRGSGEWLGGLISFLWPRCPGTIRFPSRCRVCPMIEATPRILPARVKGRLALPETWSLEAMSFAPIGFWLPDQRMRLPVPTDKDPEKNDMTYQEKLL